MGELMPHKTVKEATLLDTSILAICGGAAVVAMYPPFAAIGGLMAASGVFGVGSFFATYSKFDRLWKNLNLGKNGSFPICTGKEQTEVSTIYTFTLPAGVSAADFDSKHDAIAQFVGRDISIKYTYKAITIEVFENAAKEVYDYEVTKCPGKVEIVIGYDRRGKLITADLSKGEPHLLIAGETGSGKSTTLRAIITNVLLTKKIKLHLIDLKRGAEFQIFSKCGNVESFARTKPEAKEILNAINKEVDRRYDLFFKHDCVDISEYNRKIGGMDYQMLIIDEFADLHSMKDAISLLEEIAAKARACGIHLIISTQRPDHIILNGRIKANVTTVLGLKTTNEANSRIIIDQPGLEDLRGKGQGLLKRGNMTLVQCPYLPTQRARELLRPLYVERVERTTEPEAVDFLC